MTSETVNFFKALANETRLRIVTYLLKNDYCACDFTQMTEKDQTTVSRHLKVLVDAGILTYERDGRNIIYRIKDENVRQGLLNFGIDTDRSCW